MLSAKNVVKSICSSLFIAKEFESNNCSYSSVCDKLEIYNYDCCDLILCQLIVVVVGGAPENMQVGSQVLPGHGGLSFLAPNQSINQQYPWFCCTAPSISMPSGSGGENWSGYEDDDDIVINKFEIVLIIHNSITIPSAGRQTERPTTKQRTRYHGDRPTDR